MRETCCQNIFIAIMVDNKGGNIQQAKGILFNTGGTTSSTSHNRRWQRQQHHFDEKSNNKEFNDEQQRNDGIDYVPPVAILSEESTWVPGYMDYKTPQHLLTLSSPTENNENNYNNNNTDPTWSTSILICNERYLVVGCQSGQICFWDISQNEHVQNKVFESKQTKVRCTDEISVNNLENNNHSFKSVHRCTRLFQPDITLDLPNELGQHNTIPIVEITYAPFLLLPASVENEEASVSIDSIVVNAVLAINSVGMAYVISFTGQQNDPDQIQQQQKLCPIVEAFWNTGRLKSSSLTALDRTSTVIIGYHNNCVEAWTLMNRKKNVRLQGKHACAQLAWRASSESTNPFSISRMAQFFPKQQPNEINHQSCSLLERPYLLMLLQNVFVSTVFSTSHMLEVLDIQSLQEEWDLKEKGTNVDHDSYVQLEKHFVKPTQGMEIVDSSTLTRLPSIEDPKTMPLQSNLIPSVGTNSIYSFRNDSYLRNSTVSATVALSDGMVLQLDATMEGEKLLWGVANHHQQQVLLSYPAVGMGVVNYSPVNNPIDSSPYVSCSLRGCTVYLIPIKTKLSDNRNIITFPFPHDIETDSSMRQLQGFAAGNILVKNQSTCGRKNYPLPVLIYTWPGGLIDIYVCGLIQKGCIRSESEHRMSLLADELVVNETVDILKTYLEGLDGKSKSDVEQLEQKWKDAKDEISKYDGRKVTKEDLLSEKLKSFRSILLGFVD